MTASAETLTTSDRIRAAEAGITKAQSVLDKAQSGLRAAERVADGAHKIGQYPWQVALGVLGIAAIVTAVIVLIRRRQNRRTESVSVLAA